MAALNSEGIYNSLDEVPGHYAGTGYYIPDDGVGTRYVSNSGKMRVYHGPNSVRGLKWIFENDAASYGIKLPPNPNAPSAIMRQVQATVLLATEKLIGSPRVGEMVRLRPEPTEGDRAMAFFRARPDGECACGRAREGCPWHG
jgi:hypothetical protein